MRILLVGPSGTIGRAVAAALASRHEVLGASRQARGLQADLADTASLRALLDEAGPLDGVVCAAGTARFKPLALLDDDDFELGLREKLMGQVNLVRLALPRLRDGGSVTVTSGVLAHQPMPGSASVSLVNAGLEGFVRAAALEAPRGIRVNVVSPPWVAETLVQLGMDPQGGLPAEQVARAYVQAVEGAMTGQVLRPAP